MCTNTKDQISPIKSAYHQLKGKEDKPLSLQTASQIRGIKTPCCQQTIQARELHIIIVWHWTELFLLTSICLSNNQCFSLEKMNFNVL